MKRIFSCLIFLFILAIPGWAQKPAAVIPSFTFYSRSQPFTKEALQKDRSVFFLFFDVACEHCQQAIGFINKHAESFRNTPVYLVSLDSPVAVKKFLATYGAALKLRRNIHLLQDRNNEFITKFGPRKYPSMFLYSKEQQLLFYNDDVAALPALFKLLR